MLNDDGAFEIPSEFEPFVELVRRLSSFYSESMIEAGLSETQILAVEEGVMRRQLEDIVSILGPE